MSLEVKGYTVTTNYNLVEANTIPSQTLTGWMKTMLCNTCIQYDTKMAPTQRK